MQLSSIGVVCHVTDTPNRNGRVFSIRSTNTSDDDDDDDDGTIDAVDDEFDGGCDEEEGIFLTVGHLESESLFACDFQLLQIERKEVNDKILLSSGDRFFDRFIFVGWKYGG
mmetsp:Transcript_52063/g.58158  ORF Transcript_52063/g.58158 Transcript_52063/m.58158 type:complete len:112 (-) Transcript_52063:48-383(-)